MTPNLQTPCIGICSTIYGDTLCRGCKRSYTEVIDWNSYSDSKKLDILERLNQTITPIAEKYLAIQNKGLVIQSLQSEKSKFHPQWSAAALGFVFLRETLGKYQSLSPFGIEINPEHKNLSLEKLYETIDDEIFKVCEIN